MAITKTNHNGKTIYLGIGAEAKRLDVSRTHLWMVLNGQRQSKKLMKRVKIREV